MSRKKIFGYRGGHIDERMARETDGRMCGFDNRLRGGIWRKPENSHRSFIGFSGTH
jgi:hypothetical protein